MLVAEGRLAPADGGYVPAGDLTNLAVPETLHALIAARLDALPPPERSLIQDAAVLGQSFTVDGLAAASGQDRTPGGGAVPGAHEAGTARPERRPAVGRARPGGVRPGAHPRGRLRHPLPARPSVAPPGCRPVLRVPGRGRAGRGAWRRTTSRPIARRRTIPTAGRWRRRRRSPCGQPRRGPSSLGSHDQAVRFLVEAIEVTDDPAEIAELLERAGEAAVHVAAMDQAEPLLRDAIRRREALGRSFRAARATALLAQGFVKRLSVGGRCRPSSSRRSRRMATSSTTRRSLAIEHQLARGYWFAGRHRQGHRLRRSRHRARGTHRGRRADRRLPDHEGWIA